MWPRMIPAGALAARSPGPLDGREAPVGCANCGWGRFAGGCLPPANAFKFIFSLQLHITTYSWSSNSMRIVMKTFLPQTKSSN